MKTWPVIVRAVLYFCIAALPVVLGELKSAVDGKLQLSTLQIVWIVGSAIFSGLVALRAYIDGSFQRHLDEQKNNTPMIVLFCASLALSGCVTQNVPGRLLASTAVSVDGAMKGWAQWVVAGQATDQQEAEVRKAYTRYQMAMEAALSAYDASEKLGDKTPWERAAAALRASQTQLLALVEAFQQKEKR